jgi:hypothetical protein
MRHGEARNGEQGGRRRIAQQGAYGPHRLLQ